jgi:predicted nucleic acid-binding protein
MTVVDTSVVIDHLVGDTSAGHLKAVLERERTVAAPDLLVFEVLAVLRRHVLHGQLSADRAHGAIADLGDLSIELYPTLALRERVWRLRDNFTAADAMFIALAERLAEPFLTKDASLAAAARTHTQISVMTTVAPLDSRDTSGEPAEDADDGP